MSIVAAGSVSGFFHEVVEDAMRNRQVESPLAVTDYIVALLSDFARPATPAERALDRPLAFALDDALRTVDLAERFEKLRSLGDGVLYVSGFFGEHFRARGVDEGYLVGIGRTAYGNAGALLRVPGEERGPLDVFRELAERFATFVRVVADVAEATMAMAAGTPRELLKLYERWLRTGSDRIAKALGEHGLVPLRGAVGTLQ